LDLKEENRVIDFFELMFHPKKKVSEGFKSLFKKAACGAEGTAKGGKTAARGQQGFKRKCQQKETSKRFPVGKNNHINKGWEKTQIPKRGTPVRADSEDILQKKENLAEGEDSSVRERHEEKV